MSYYLQPNEKVILKETAGDGEVVLTEKDIIVYKEKKHLFKETEIYLKRYPLSKINMINGEPQVYSQKVDTMEYVFVFCSGEEVVTLRLDESGKDKTIKWINAIYRLLIGRDSNEKGVLGSIFDAAKNITGKGSAVLGQAIGGTIGSIAGNIRNKYIDNFSSNNVEEENKDKIINSKCIGCGTPLAGRTNQLIRCEYCGTKQKL